MDIRFEEVTSGGAVPRYRCVLASQKQRKANFLRILQTSLFAEQRARRVSQRQLLRLSVRGPGRIL